MVATMEPLEMSAQIVVLEPLGERHGQELADAVQDGGLHMLWYANVPPPDGMTGDIRRRLALQEAGTMLPFAIRRLGDGLALGMTRYFNIDRVLPRVDIGATWLRASACGTGANVDAKLLLLRQAFDRWECPAVEFRTHSMNTQSRSAIERLGTNLDGDLRSHSRIRDGSLRDTAVYSITADEWPGVQAGLAARLARHETLQTRAISIRPWRACRPDASSPVPTAPWLRCFARTSPGRHRWLRRAAHGVGPQNPEHMRRRWIARHTR